MPEGDAGLEVAGETRRWVEGKCMLFDDSYLHSSWNEADSERVILLFDVWHPDIAAEERAAIAAMFRDQQRARE